jgi:hypothetical protein
VCVAPGGASVDAPVIVVPDAPPIVDAARLADAPSCQPSAFVSCKDADTAVFCNPAGDGLVEQPCPAGCDGSVRRCLLLQPSNLPNACDPPATAPDSRVLAGDTSVDTDGCVTGGGLVVGQGAGLPELCVHRFTDLTLPQGATMTARGKRALVLIALRRMVIAGTLDASARLLVGGPGADEARVSGRGASAGADRSEGGGGGGHATVGAAGGPVEGIDISHPGGGALGNSTLSPLTAGGFGGAGGYPCPTGGPPCVLRSSGGGGGGAVPLIACAELDLRATAVIHAGGGGGSGGVGLGATAGVPGGGDGGGAGGAVLIEAPRITVPGGATLVANGGGGGGGGAIGDLVDASGKAGDDGPLAERPAAGGEGGSQVAGKGGRGGAGGGPETGAKGISGGGGGGAAGRIRLNARPDRPPEIAGSAIVSPEPSTGAITRR